MDFEAWLGTNKATLDAWGDFVVAKVSELVKLEVGPERFETFFKVPPGHRVKAKASAVKKQLKKNYEDPRVGMTDLVGARFVVLLRHDIDIVERVIVGYPDWVRSKDRSPDDERDAKPQHFDYQSVHYVVRNSDDLPLGEVVVPAGTPCEVQIRTVLQHAYAELVHDNFYKGEGYIPPSASRLVARCMALMETTDEMFVGAVDELSRVNQTREAWCKCLDDSVGPLIPSFRPTDEDEDALAILDQFSDLLATASTKEVLDGLNNPVRQKIQADASSNALFCKPVVLLVYWLVANHPYDVGARWPVPGLQAGLDQVKAHLGCG